MKLKIKGEVTLPVLGEAFSDMLQHIEFDKDRFFINGATVYFNLYDNETGKMLEVIRDGKILDLVEWATPVVQAKEQLAARRRKPRTPKKT